MEVNIPQSASLTAPFRQGGLTEGGPPGASAPTGEFGMRNEEETLSRFATAPFCEREPREGGPPRASAPTENPEMERNNFIHHNTICRRAQSFQDVIVFFARRRYGAWR